MPVYLFEQHLSEVVMLQEMAKPQDSDFIRHAVQLQTRELTHGLDLVQHGSRGRIAEIIEQLDAVNP